jgi:hypothetical protein
MVGTVKTIGNLVRIFMALAYPSLQRPERGKEDEAAGLGRAIAAAIDRQRRCPLPPAGEGRGEAPRHPAEAK